MEVGGSACLEDEMMNRLYAWLFLGYDLATTWLRLGDRDGVFTVCLDELHMQYSILLSASPSRYPGTRMLRHRHWSHSTCTLPPYVRGTGRTHRVLDPEKRSAGTGSTVLHHLAWD